MSICDIITHPDPILRKKSEDVSNFDDELKKLIGDMKETMKSTKGLGLAAVQIGHLLNVFVVDEEAFPLKKATEDFFGKKQLNFENYSVFVNPQIIEKSKQTIVFEEGCLSVPGITAKIGRPRVIRVRAKNESGEEFEIEASDLYSVVIQHEYDHLIGKEFFDYLPRETRRKLGIHKIMKSK